MTKLSQQVAPVFPHDCAACVFLGRHFRTDLYFCACISPPLVKSRFGTGGDYESTHITDSFSHIPRLAEAVRRAYDHGLIAKLPETAKAPRVDKKLKIMDG